MASPKKVIAMGDESKRRVPEKKGHYHGGSALKLLSWGGGLEWKD